MHQKKKTLWDKFGKANFAFFYKLIKACSPNWSRRFLYVGLEDKSIYEDCFTDPVLHIDVLGKKFPNPLGIAAGFDTSFKYNDELIQYGFGFEEFGTFTLRPCHEEARLHFLSGQKSILVSQPLFANQGILFAQKALIDRRHLPFIAGISIACNMDAKDDLPETKSVFDDIQKELVEMTQRTAPYCDYIVLNLSHPSLPISNLLTNLSILEETVHQLKYVISKVAPIAKPKLLVKLPPHIPTVQVSLLAESFLHCGIDGLIIGGYLNERTQNMRLAGRYISGYICGQPIKDASGELTAAFYRATEGKLPIIACGGVFSGDDAFEKIQNGASLVQIHSAILFKGPSVGNEISKRLAFLLKTNGFKDVQEAVGAKVKKQI